MSLIGISSCWRSKANSKIILFDGEKVIVQDAELKGSPVKTFMYGQNILEFE